MIKNNSCPEIAIQQIWLEQDFDQVTLKMICGQQVKIEFAGWYNSASGPDFREARLKIGKQYLLGAVEIQNHHEGNLDYNEVVRLIPGTGPFIE